MGSNCKCGKDLEDRLHELENDIDALYLELRDRGVLGVVESPTPPEDIVLLDKFEDDTPTASTWFSIGFSVKNYERIEKIADSRKMSVNDFCASAVLELVEIIEMVAEEEVDIRSASPIEQFNLWASNRLLNAVQDGNEQLVAIYEQVSEWINRIEEEE